MGPVFALRMQEETSADVGRIARAYAIVREVFGIRTTWAQIENIDNVIHANVQYSMMFQTTRLLRYATMWLLQQVDGSPAIEDWVSRLQPGVRNLLKDLPGLLIGRLKKRYDETVRLYLDIGVPNRLAVKVAALPASFSAMDIVEVARLTGTPARQAGAVYFELGMGLGLDWLRDEIEGLKVEGRWQAVARSSLRENLFMLHRRLTFQVLSIDNAGTPRDVVLAWLDKSAEKVSHSKRVLKEMRASGNLDFPTLSVALQEIRKLAMTT
jgi:glutamate dehydrogenase